VFSTAMALKISGLSRTVQRLFESQSSTGRRTRLVVAVPWYHIGRGSFKRCAYANRRRSKTTQGLHPPVRMAPWRQDSRRASMQVAGLVARRILCYLSPATLWPRQALRLHRAVCSAQRASTFYVLSCVRSLRPRVRVGVRAPFLATETILAYCRRAEVHILPGHPHLVRALLPLFLRG